MKKHLLFIQSLLLLSFIPVSFLSSMHQINFNNDFVVYHYEKTNKPIEVINEEPISLSFINKNQRAIKSDEDLAKETHKQKFSNTLEVIENNIITLTPPNYQSKAQQELNQSIIVIPMPEIKGLDGWLYSRSFYLSPEDNVYLALKEGLFNEKNSTHLDLLEKAFDTFVENNNSKRIMLMLQICQYAAGKMEISEKFMRKTHNFLENIAAAQEKETRETLEKKATEFINQRNALILAFQEDMNNRTNELHTMLNQYQEEYNSTFTQQANYLRELKESTIITHTLYPQLKLASNEPCSDEIKCLRSPITKKKVFMGQQDIATVYSNEFLLKKIGLDQSKASTEQSTHNLLATISAINKNMQEIKLLNS